MKLFWKKTASDWWRIITNHGDAYGDLIHDGNNSRFSDTACALNSTVAADDTGVFSRRDTLQNLTDKPLHVACMNTRFVLDGGEYDVYTQYNAWQNENLGQWQPLVTEVEARTESFRTSWAAAPFLAVWNKQTNRGIAFHLLPDCAWRMSARRVPLEGENSQIIIELGPDYCSLDLEIQPGETVNFPEVLYYEISDRTDMDCRRLHRYCHKRWPRRELPVIYNSWMYRFDQVGYDVIAPQIAAAAEIGAEYFVIDAGWFGHGSNWSAAVGDWKENETAQFCGRLIDVADEVRRHGMKFGLWFEPERAAADADAPKAHPEYYLRGNSGYYFLDFANPDARRSMLETIAAQIEKYGIEFVKFDFNADLVFDERRTAFMEYFKGYREFISELKRRFPTLYFENCASGGERMDLGNLSDFHSFWPSDCQSPYVGLRIIKDGLKRLPPQAFERWFVVQSAECFKPAYGADSADKLIACGDGTWDHLSGVQRSFMEAFLAGGPIGLSCDLNALSADAFAWLKSYITEFKRQRDFWKTAECQILTDTDSALVLQYNAPDFRLIRLQTVAFRIAQSQLRIYPNVPKNAVFVDENGAEITGEELSSVGITVPQALDYRAANYRMQEIILKAK